MTKRTQWQRGFTLAEMAVVLVLMGLAMSMGLKMVTSTLENVAYSESKSKLERIKTALVGHLRTNGRLPCPDITTDPSAASYGTQDRVSNSADSACTFPNGVVTVVPWRDIGLSRDEVVDGWGNFFTYRVANNFDARNWTSRAVGTPFDITQLTTPTANVLTMQENNGGGLTPINPSPVVVIVSHGKNGLGSRTVKGTTNTAPLAGTDEATNATVSSAAFIRRPFTEDAGATGGAFDDLVAFMTPLDLLQPLVNEGTLKACAAYCPSGVSSTCSTAGECTCSAEGVIGTATTCTGTCGICSTPAAASCLATGIPIGATPVNCP